MPERRLRAVRPGVDPGQIMPALKELARGALPLAVLAGVALAGAGQRQGPRRWATDSDNAAAPTDRPGHSADLPKSSAGRDAQSPAEIPPRGWKEILLRVKSEFAKDQIALIAAGVTFYTVLAIFPGVAAFVSLYALLGDPEQLDRHLQALSHLMPGGAVKVIRDQMQAVLAAHAGGLSFAFLVGLLTSVWSANGAVKATMIGLNVAYEVEEHRGMVRRTLISLAFTLGLTLFGLAAAAALGAATSARSLLGAGAVLVEACIWAALLVGMIVGLALLYRFGPDRGPVRLRWITWGSAAAVLSWLGVSAAFTAYVANFGHYNKTYGSLGAVVGFMTWIYLSAMVVLAGAELNSEIERQAQDAPKRPASG